MLALAAFLFLMPQVGNDITPPVGAQASIVAIGHGVQIYKCTTNAAGNALQWMPQGPEADLFDQATKQPVGTHTAGPTWTWHDGSALTGKVLASQPSADPGAIPWLLLEVHSTGAAGALANIRYIRRTDTQAGAAPDGGCDVAHQDNVLRVPYQATYTFYTAH